MYAFSGQVRICGQTFGDPNVGGQPFREYWNRIPSSVMVVHLSPLQSSHDVGSIDGSIIPKHLEPPHRFVHGLKGAPDLTSVSRYVAAAVHEHFLLFSLPLLHSPLEYLTPALLLLPLALLAISGLVSHRDENFFPFGVALALGMPSPMSVQTVRQVPLWGSWCVCSGPQVQGKTFAWIAPSCCGWCPSAGQTLAAYSPEG